MIKRLDQSFQYDLSNSILVCAGHVRHPIWIQAVPGRRKENDNVEHQDGLRSPLGYGSPCHDCHSDAFPCCANVFTLTLLRLFGIVVGSFARVEVIFDAHVVDAHVVM